MNPLSLSTTAGKLFWCSLLSYCIAFSGFYFLTQYTQNTIEHEEKSGLFATFKDTACHHVQYCGAVSLSNEFDPIQKRLITKLDMPYKLKKSIDQVQLQQDYTTLINALPWYVKRRFSDSIEIRAIDIDQPNKK